MTLSADLVSEWINAFSITCTVSDRLDGIYPDSEPSSSTQKLHKEEMKYRRTLDFKDRDHILAEVDKYPHPLEDNKPHLYNPVTGQIASRNVNVADSVVIGEKMENNFIANLPDGFYKAISSTVKTMCMLKGQTKGIQSKPVIDLETIFLRLLAEDRTGSFVCL